MKKSLKIFAVVLIAMLVVFSVSTSSYADSAKDVIGGINAEENSMSEDAAVIINCLGKKNLHYINLAFTHFFGEKKGRNLYLQMKKQMFKNNLYH